MRRKHWWPQFSLRTLLLLVLVVSLPVSWFAVRMQKAIRQREAAEALEALGCIVAFDNDTASPRSDWLGGWFGDDVFLVVGNESEVSDTDLMLLAEFSQLKTLYLDRTDVTDAGLEHLSGLHNLDELWLSDTQVTDAGLEHLTALDNLGTLVLDGTNVSDAGLDSLRRIESLRMLSLPYGKITLKQVERLQEALPNCSIHY